MKNNLKKLELLAPAKNLAVGIAAIDAGADAVYIGASKFGARSEAGNDFDDIKTLVEYAHQFRVKVYVAFNTILFDNELEEAKKFIRRIYDIKVDGLIIQDMGILEMDLPPIPLIASTQMHNYDLDKIKFLEKIGFKRVILARELSLDQIKTIKDNTCLELETFVHGALCVSFSGRCYMSEALANRSANRGECIQACRLPYSLVDSDGKVLSNNKYLLSLKDFNASQDLEKLIDAGAVSFKIEGRLKDEDYVTNVVSYYRKKLDEIIRSRSDLQRSSCGHSVVGFEPDPAKSFNRGFCDYFLQRRNKDILAVDSPKSIGKSIGKVKSVSKDHFVLDSAEEINNGDGLCFFGKDNNLYGSNVNKVMGDKIFLNDMRGLSSGIEVYRNFDIAFSKRLKIGRPKRTIDVSMIISETADGFDLRAEDEEGNKAIVGLKAKKELAQNKETAENMMVSQLSKTGETIYAVSEVRIDSAQPYFLKISVLNEMRRKVLDLLSKERRKIYKQEIFKIKDNDEQFPLKELSYESNVANGLARKFYEKHGVKKIDPAFELSKERKGKKVMTTKHCLKHYFGYCSKESKGGLKEPLYLVNERGQKFLLKFDCSKCQMSIHIE